MADQSNGGKTPFDPFDPAALRLDQTFCEGTAVKKLLTTVPVRKPNRQDFVRVHADPTYRLSPAAIIELKEEREWYLVAPPMVPDLTGEVIFVSLYTAVTRQGVTHIWPVRLPTPDGRQSTWHTSAQTAAELAMSRWMRVTANMALGAYEVFEASAAIPDPEWPEATFHELLRIAFQGRLIDRLDHPVVLKLKGQA
jgi:hypothetical protein